MEKLNFNQLAWEAPEHDGKYGYLPTDKYYDEIIAWLKSGEKVWTSKVGGITTCRISFETAYDAIAEYNHKNKMVSWVFRGRGEFQIN